MTSPGVANKSLRMGNVKGNTSFHWGTERASEKGKGVPGDPSGDAKRKKKDVGVK